MKKETEKRNAAQIKALIEAKAPQTVELEYGEGEDKFAVKVNPLLPFSKRAEMIREISDGVFMESKNSINTYTPEYLDLIQKYTVIKYFTDLQLPNKIDDMWLVLNYTGIYEDVVQSVGKREIDEIFKAANASIEAYKRYLAAKTDANSFIEKIGKALGNFESKISQDDIKDITSKLKDMPSGFSLQELIGNMLGNKDAQG